MMTVLVPHHNIAEHNHIDCISVNETFLDRNISDSEVNINEFMLFRNDRNKNGGFVALYVNSKFHPKLISFTPQSESIWIQI